MSYIAVDFFAGAGGLSEGLKQAGFEVAVANEKNIDAAKTYTHNHPETTMITKSIRSVKAPEILKITGERPFLVAGGPPCQGFSMAGRRDINDPRNKLFKYYLGKIRQIKPEFVLMENVVGLLSFNQGKTVSAIKKGLEKTGYSVSMRVLNAVDFGVPQVRKRLFIVGSPDMYMDINTMIVKKTMPVSVENAIGDLDFVGPGQTSTEYEKTPKGAYQKQMRLGSKDLNNHVAPRHSKRTIERFSNIRPGCNGESLPQHLRTNKRTQLRLEGRMPARTVITIPDDYIHPSLNRTLTVRECARLQSFRDKYLFLGPKSTGGTRRKSQCPQYTQIGNAVPPLLGAGVGSWILKQAK